MIFVILYVKSTSGSNGTVNNCTVYGMREYILYCDEGEKKGKNFSNFYGGLLVHSGKIDFINNRLRSVKDSLFMNNGELKGTKITQNYADKYIVFLKEVFSMINEDLFKVRIMCTSNKQYSAMNLEDEIDLTYFKLYYKFIKYAFGFRYIEDEGCSTLLRVFLDNLPDQSNRKNEFKKYLNGLSRTNIFIKSSIIVEDQHIVEICSKKHILAQALDIIIHLVEFKLNGKNLIQGDAKEKSNRCLAKIKVYQQMIEEIQNTHPNFNIGVTTGKRGNIENYWNDAYRHWILKTSPHSY